MAGTIIVSSIKTDTDNSFIVRSNTGATLFSVDTTSISIPDGSITSAMIANGTVIAADVADGSITDAKIAAVANTKITGLITGSQIASDITLNGNTTVTTLVAGAGSNTSPSITASGDTNTGMFFPAADTIAFAEGGTEAMRIDSSGNVGIGTTSPSYKLQVYGASNPEMRLGDAVVTYQLYTEGATAAVMGTVGSHALVFRTNATERMRIDSSGNLLFNSGYGSAATAYGCRAWVNFNGTGTVAIRASGNVTSITDNGTGEYTINFTTAMPDANYATVLGGNWSGTAAITSIAAASPTYSTSAVKVQIVDRNGTAQDISIVSAAIIR